MTGGGEGRGEEAGSRPVKAEARGRAVLSRLRRDGAGKVAATAPPFMKTTLLLFTAALLFTASGRPLFAQSAAPFEVARPILKLPATITKPGTYILRSNLVFKATTGRAISVNADFVTIDLGGKVLVTTAPADVTNTTEGIHSNASNLTVRNGVIRGFATGVGVGSIGAPGRTLVEHLEVSDGGDYGISLYGDILEVRDCHVRDARFASSPGIAVVGIQTQGHAAIIRDCEVLNQAAVGVQEIGIQTTNSFGTDLQNNVVCNTIAHTGIIGIQLLDPSGAFGFVRANRVSNFHDGITFVANSQARYSDNQTTLVINPFTNGTAVGTENK